jgi:ABC-type multidrug transport system ATPase subunit
MLNVRSASKRYGKTTVLDGVTFDLDAGQVLAIVGSNGAGKSTLLKSILGLLHFEGDIEVDGISVTRQGQQARRRIGYLPQHPAFHADLSVHETATFYARIRGVPVAEALAAVEAVGLAEHAGKAVGALSGGMRQRLALAVAQLGDPALLVLDEPTAGLDVGARLELRHFIAGEQERGRTVVLSTHWMEDVPAMADLVLVLDQGKTTYFGPSSTFTAAASPQSRMFLRLNGRTDEAIPLITSLAGTVTHEGEWVAVTCLAASKAQVLAALFGAGIKVLDFRVEDAALPSTIDTGGRGGLS